jgi:hypothetical protein
VVGKTEDVCNNTVIRRQAAGPVKLERCFGGVERVTAAISGSARCVTFSFCVAEFIISSLVSMALASYAALCATCLHITQLPFAQSIGCNHDFLRLGLVWVGVRKR